jgi:hypothetical protein
LLLHTSGEAKGLLQEFPEEIMGTTPQRASNFKMSLRHVEQEIDLQLMKTFCTGYNIGISFGLPKFFEEECPPIYKKSLLELLVNKYRELGWIVNIHEEPYEAIHFQLPDHASQCTHCLIV